MNKKIFAAAAAVAVTAGGAAAIIANASSAKAEEDVSYREYSVSKGNITVGTEESGTLSLDREYVSFPCTAEVTEVYVKTGTSVKEGDALLKVDPDDVAEAKKQYELKLRTLLMRQRTTSPQAPLKLSRSLKAPSSKAHRRKANMSFTSASRKTKRRPLPKILPT